MTLLNSNIQFLVRSLCCRVRMCSCKLDLTHDLALWAVRVRHAYPKATSIFASTRKLLPDTPQLT